jgi:hypothetical protein
MIYSSHPSAPPSRLVHGEWEAPEAQVGRGEDQEAEVRAATAVLFRCGDGNCRSRLGDDSGLGSGS